MTEFVNFAFSTQGVPATVNSVSTARTLPDRLDDIINVRDYGATGDGVTDDLNAIIAAYTWNNVNLTTAARAYSGAFRAVSATWAASEITVTLSEAHGWTGTVLLVAELFGTKDGPGDAIMNGNKTATVVDATSIKWAAATTPFPIGFYGCVRPQVTGTTTWAANRVDVTFDQAHNLITGLTCTVAGFVSASINGSVVITVDSATTLHFTVSGSGTISTNGTIKPVGLLTFAALSVPSTVNNTSACFLASVYPTTYGAYYSSSVGTATTSTVTLGFPLLADIPISTLVRFQFARRGKLYFPPGTYKITAGLDVSDANLQMVFEGEPGAAITGDVAGYLLDRNLKSAQGGPILFQGLTLINTNAVGGGLRFVTVPGAARNLRIEAHFGICTAGDDYVHGTIFDGLISGCILTPGAHVSGSIGIAIASNAISVFGNYISGFDYGVTASAFGLTFKGNYVVDCGVAGLEPGLAPDLAAVGHSLGDIRGNIFKNNAIGIYAKSFSGSIEGNYIEGGAGATYGFRSDSSLSGLTRALEVSGTFATAAVNYAVQSGNIMNNPVRSVRATKSGVASFVQPIDATRPSNNYITLSQSNVTPVYTYANVLGRCITAASWSGGTMTLTTASNHGITNGLTIEVVGLQYSGSNDPNGIWLVATGATNSITYAMALDPGTMTNNTGSVTTTIGGTSSVPIKALTWLANVATCETWGNHGLNPGSTATIAGVTGATTYNGDKSGTFTVTSLTTFTFPLVGDPGAPGNIAASVAAVTITTASIVLGRTYTGARPNTWQGLTVNISDGAKVGTGAAAIGEYLQGGGSGHYEAVWTANGWQRSG